MYDRMLEKDNPPSLEVMAAYCGPNSQRFLQLNQWLAGTFATEQNRVFPYGNRYGWGIAHRKKKQLVCNVFPEDGAFTVMLRLSDPQFASVYERVAEYAREYINHKYPCGSGGWIHYRVTSQEQFADIQTLLTAKFRRESGDSLIGGFV